MREIAVYFIRDDSNDMAYLCQGVLLDDLRRAGYNLSKSRGCNSRLTIKAPGGYQVVVRREILACSDEEYSKLSGTESVCISKEAEGAPSWGIYKVPHEEDKWGIDRRRNNTGVQHELRNTQHVAEVRKLNTVIYEPASLPVRTTLNRDGNGRLFCRMSIHADLEGKLDPGKLYFPDRSWEDPMEGEALVIVVAESDAYGFIKGKMIGYEMPDYSLIAQWAQNNLRGATKLYIITGSDHGNYIGYYDVSTSEYHRIEVVDGKVHSKVYFAILEDIEAGKFTTLTVSELVTKYSKS